tara:strand:- start:6145 stop:6474 length:330 start_codon:yes stop_codon:yes gene_type:complete
MKVLRQVGQFKLNEGNLMAKGMYNMTNTILVEHTKDEGVSYWFDTETKDLLMRCSDAEFGQRAKQLAGNNISDCLPYLKVKLQEAKETGISSYIDKCTRDLDEYFERNN